MNWIFSTSRFKWDCISLGTKSGDWFTLIHKFCANSCGLQDLCKNPFWIYPRLSNLWNCLSSVKQSYLMHATQWNVCCCTCLMDSYLPWDMENLTLLAYCKAWTIWLFPQAPGEKDLWTCDSVIQCHWLDCLGRTVGFHYILFLFFLLLLLQHPDSFWVVSSIN